jgi:glycosyltransferase involved in cell wall biosynthesis
MMTDNDRTRVLFMLVQLDAGGSERVVLDLVRGLDRDRFDPYVVAFKGGVLESELCELCVNVFLIDKKHGFDLSAMRQVARIIRENRIAVVNAHHYMPFFYSFLGARLLNRRKLIYTEHSVPEVEIIVSGKHEAIFRHLLAHLDAVVGVSRAVTERFKMHYPRHADKFRTILNGVDLTRFGLTGNRDAIRTELALSSEHFVVGIVANFRRVKNHACLVRAVARLKDSLPQLRVVIVGTGFPDDQENSEAEVRSLIRQLDVEKMFILVGQRHDVPRLLAALDLFCLPSFSEGLPVSLLEAMACGLPVIGSDVSGIVEVIRDRETGLLFPSDDDAELSLLMTEMIGNQSLRRLLGHNGQEFVARNHGFPGWINAYSQLLTA